MKFFKRAIKRSFASAGLQLTKTPAYGANVYADIRKILPQDKTLVLLDVGANEGQTAMAFETEFSNANIHSFEPNPAAYSVLRRKFTSSRRVFPRQLALGAEKRLLPLHITQSSVTSSLLPVSQEASFYLGDCVVSAGDKNVEVIRLDDFLEQEKIPHVDLLKMDTQGYELQVLAGGERAFANAQVSLVLTEVNFVSLYDGQAFFAEVYQKLTSLGFKLVGLYHADYRSGPYIAWCDALFVFPKNSRATSS